MSRVRIRAKAPPSPPADRRFPRINGIATTWSDLEIMLVADDGSEHWIPCVSRVEIDLQPSTEPLTVKLTILDPELDVEGFLELVAAGGGA